MLIKGNENLCIYFFEKSDKRLTRKFNCNNKWRKKKYHNINKLDNFSHVFLHLNESDKELFDHFIIYETMCYDYFY